MAAPNDSGITAVQMAVAVVIVGVLVYLAIPIWGQAVERSKAMSCQANQRNIAEAIDLARQDGNIRPPVGYYDNVLEPGHDWGKALIPVYLSKAPRCPVTRSLYFMSPLGAVWSDKGASQYTWTNQGLANDHRLPKNQ